MRHRSRLLGLSAVAVVLITAQAWASPSTGRLETHADFTSNHIAARTVEVWLPPGYADDAPPHAVLYMQDGQNLFNAEAANFGVEWNVDDTLGGLIAAGRARPTIVVGIASAPARFQEYAPAKGLARAPEAVQWAIAQERGGESLSEAYLRFLVDELKPFIEQTYRVSAAPEDTFIAGSSMGGLISLYALVERPDVFGGAAALSTHWPFTIDQRRLETRPDQLKALAQAMADYLLDHKDALAGKRLYFDYGTATLDQYYPPLQGVIDAALGRFASEVGLVWTSRRFEGAAHFEAGWAARLDQPLMFLLEPMSRAANAP
ncbi:MAG: alpha/beta hydrolase [Maricaulaceae bacterium]